MSPKRCLQLIKKITFFKNVIRNVDFFCLFFIKMLTVNVNNCENGKSMAKKSQ